MKAVAKFIAATGMLLSLTGHAQASSTSWFDQWQTAWEQGKGSVYLHIDNDSLLLDRSDGFYSSGGRIGQESWLHQSDKSISAGWRIGQDLYTSSDIKLPPEQISPRDHPYAAWLFIGAYQETWRLTGMRSKVGIDIGCIGPCAGGEWTQKNLHRLIDQPLPQGWNRQVRNEAGVVLYGEVTPRIWMASPSIEIAPVIHGRFGNIHTDAGVALRVRAGRLNARPTEPTLHAFARLDATAVAYNATLQGGYFSDDNPHTVRPKRVVGEAEIGAQWVEGNWSVSASVIHRTNEIKDLPSSVGDQNYARLLFSYAY